MAARTNPVKRMVVKWAHETRLLLWRLSSRYPNQHLAASSARPGKVPTTGERIYLRPSRSDKSRVFEYVTSIYAVDSYLLDAVKKSSPSLLIDIGANIGMSSLALANQFPSISTVVGIEAERENYGVLEKNYSLWSSERPDVEFIPVHAVAVSDNSSHFVMGNLGHGNSELSASGTFSFAPAASTSQATGDGTPVQEESITIAQILEKYGDGPMRTICKLDIEGGEEYLLDRNNEWLGEVAFLTVETHDRYQRELLNSSRGLMRALVEYDFAIHPEHDILHCYSRRLFGDSG